MTTASEAFGAPVGVGGNVSAPVADVRVPQPHAGMRARGYRSLSVFGKVHRAASVTWADVSGAWPWRESPPALRQVWASARPAVEAVPAKHKGLHAGWVVWNYTVALPSTFVLYVAAWLLQHPARAGLTAALLIPLMFVIFR